MTDTGTALLDAVETIYAAVAASGNLGGRITGMFNGTVPVNQVYPYLTFDTHVETPFPVFGKPLNRQITQVIGIWSKSDNDEEALRVLSALNGVIDNKTLVGTLFSHAITYTQGTAQFDPELRITTMPCTYRIYSSMN